MQKCNMRRFVKQHWDLFVAVHLFQATDVSAAVAGPLRLFDFPPNGAKPPASSRSASAKLSLIFSPEF